MQKRPTSAIMGDDWYGHRNPLTGQPQGDRDEYLSWDWSLLNAFQTIEDYTDQKSGLPSWELDDDNVYVDADRKINKFQAAIDKKTKGTKTKPYVPTPGEFFQPNMKSHAVDENGNPVFQTFRQYVEKSIRQERG